MEYLCTIIAVKRWSLNDAAPSAVDRKRLRGAHVCDPGPVKTVHLKIWGLYTWDFHDILKVIFLDRLKRREVDPWEIFSSSDFAFFSNGKWLTFQFSCVSI